MRLNCLGRRLLLACAMIAPAGIAHAAVVTPGAGNGADTFVQNGSTTNNSTSADLVVKFTGTDTDTTNRKGYIRFDTTSLPTPGNITAASLVLTVSINNGGGSGATTTTPQNFTYNVYGLNDGSSGETWNPTTITYANAPANNTASGSTVTTGTGANQATLLGTFSMSQTDVAGTPITALSGSSLVDFLNANTDNLATFIVTRTGFTPNPAAPSIQGNANSAFASAEAAAAARPALTATPEPGSAALLGLASLCCLRRKRR